MADRPNRLLASALWYIKQGWPVFPIYWVNEDGSCSCDDPHAKNETSVGKHPLTPRGMLDASLDPEQVKTWWTEFPKANIGIATGEPSGLIVLDVDPIHSGDFTLEALIEEHGALAPEAPHVRTGSGGDHYYFAYREGAGSRNGLAQGIDVKADGGYVIAPPSGHYSGRTYAWIDNGPRRGQEQLVLPDAPDWAFLQKASRNGSSHYANGSTSEKIIRQGSRNSTLTQIAGMWRHRGYQGTEIFELLKPYNERFCEPPLPEDELYSIAFGMERYGENAVMEFTDLGNARRFARRHGNDVRYTESYGWLYWDGYWVRDKTKQIMQRAIDTVDALSEEREYIDDEKALTALNKWINASQTSSHIRAVQDVAQGLPGIAIESEVFDANIWLLNMRNGTFNLKTGELQSHNRLDYITKQAPVDYEPEAKCPVFEQFMLDIMGGDEELVEYLQRLFGYVITGSTQEAILPIFHGSGSNGKTTLLNAISFVLGPDYSGAAPPGLLIEKNSESHPTEYADLQGKRLVTASETGSGKKLAESAMKYLTGGDKIKARYMRQDFFEFVANFKIILLTNNKPLVRGQDFAVWRRLKLIPFNVTFSADEVDKEMSLKLQAEAPGIMNWLLTGCMNWQGEGLGREPEAVRLATAEYKRESDVLADFRDERLYFEPDEKVSRDQLYASYIDWAKKQGIKTPYTKSGFGRLMTQVPQIAKKSFWVNGKTVWFWLGIGIKHSQVPNFDKKSQRTK